IGVTGVQTCALPIFPTAPTTELDAEAKMRDHAQTFFEETWIHRPYRGLSGVPPIDAAGSPMLRKRLRGVVQFYQDCSAGTAPRLYDFDRLRRKFGLEAGAAPAAAPAAPAAATEAAPDVSAMGMAELAALDPATLADA